MGSWNDIEEMLLDDSSKSISDWWQIENSATDQTHPSQELQGVIVPEWNDHSIEDKYSFTDDANPEFLLAFGSNLETGQEFSPENLHADSSENLLDIHFLHAESFDTEGISPMSGPQIDFDTAIERLPEFTEESNFLTDIPQGELGASSGQESALPTENRFFSPELSSSVLPLPDKNSGPNAEDSLFEIENPDHSLPMEF